MIRGLISILIICVMLMTGCSSPEEKIPLEKLGMVGVLAFDYIDENTTKLSVAIPQFLPDVEQNVQIFTIETELVSDGIFQVERLSDKKIILNQLRVVLINEEFARKGNVEKIVKHLYRSAEVGNKVLLAVVKGSSCEDLLNGNYPDKPKIDFYLNDLLQPSINTAFNPNTNIHDFIYTQTNPVIDSILPVLEKKHEKVEIKGVALFKNQHMHNIITPHEALVIQALQGKKQLSPLPIVLDQDNETEKVFLDLIENDVKMKSNKDIESPKLSINLSIKGTLSEYKGKRENNLNTPAKLSKLEKDVSKQIEREIRNFIQKTIEQDIDPIGLSENFRRYYHGQWTNELTDKILNNLEFDIHVQTSIISTGTLK